MFLHLEKQGFASGGSNLLQEHLLENTDMIFLHLILCSPLRLYWELYSDIEDLFIYHIFIEYLL